MRWGGDDVEGSEQVVSAAHTCELAGEGPVMLWCEVVVGIVGRQLELVGLRPLVACDQREAAVPHDAPADEAAVGRGAEDGLGCGFVVEGAGVDGVSLGVAKASRAFAVVGTDEAYSLAREGLEGFFTVGVVVGGAVGAFAPADDEPPRATLEFTAGFKMFSGEKT